MNKCEFLYKKFDGLLEASSVNDNIRMSKQIRQMAEGPSGDMLSSLKTLNLDSDLVIWSSMQHKILIEFWKCALEMGISKGDVSTEVLEETPPKFLVSRESYPMLCESRNFYANNKHLSEDYVIGLPFKAGTVFGYEIYVDPMLEIDNNVTYLIKNSKYNIEIFESKRNNLYEIELNFGSNSSIIQYDLSILL